MIIFKFLSFKELKSRMRMRKKIQTINTTFLTHIQIYRYRYTDIQTYIYMLFAGQEVHIGKNCALGLECPRSWVLKTKGTVFPNMDRPRSANNVFILFSLENFFIRNIFVDFLLQQFHTVCVCLTFCSSKPMLFTEVFKKRDSVFGDFKLSNKWFTFHGDF